MTILTRKQKERLVADLYFNQNETYREISRLTRTYPREIKKILERASAENESEHSLSKQAQAYKMFNEGKTPMEVAITLDLPEPEVTRLYKESWNLKQIGDLNQIYLETRGNLALFLMLHNLAKTQGFTTEHIVSLIRVANYDLPALEHRVTNLKSEVESLEATKKNSAKIIRDYDNQISTLGNTFYDICLRCEQEEKKLADLRTKRVEEESLVRHFENNDEEYVKITRIVEEKARATLSNRKRLLELAALALIESIRENPSKYSSLIPHDLSSTTDFVGPDFNPFYTYGLQWPQQQTQAKAYFTEDYAAMLAEDTNRLMEKLVMKLEDEILSDYPVNISQPSLITY